MSLQVSSMVLAYPGFTYMSMVSCGLEKWLCQILSGLLHVFWSHLALGLSALASTHLCVSCIPQSQSSLDLFSWWRQGCQSRLA